MKRLTIIIMALALAAGLAQARNWCEVLVSNLNMNSDLDKTVAVNRQPDTHEITNATYDFRFSSSKLYKQIYNTLKGHAHESDYYSESGSKNKTIIMRFTDNGRCWSCKLQSDSRNKQFLVSVKSEDAGTGTFRSIESIMSAEEVQEAAEKARCEARKAQAEARKAAAEAQAEARKAAAEARREARKAQAESRKAVSEAQAAARKASAQRRQVTEVRTSNSSVINIAPEDANQKAAIDNHNQKLRQAELERKKKLGL